MDEERLQDYLNLIDALLTCPSQREQILNANWDLVDAGLLKVMKQVAVVMAQKGNREAAQSLQIFTSRLSFAAFWIEVLQAIANSNGDLQLVYPLLKANLDLLDDKFVQMLRGWATYILPGKEPEQARITAAYIADFSKLIQEFPLGNPAINLEIAIEGYEVAATALTRQASPIGWATIQNNLGNVYCGRIWGEKAENLEAAIRCFSAALEISSRKAFPKDWADTQNNLGITYYYRIRGEKAENLETAIHCYSAALEVRTREAFPFDWAVTQNNLGNAYSKRLLGEPAENWEAAIRCYSAALQECSRETFPEQWAITQNNLGIAYRNRLRGERAENLEVAICCYSAALEKFTRETFPQDWAMTQNNLGNAYRDRIWGKKVENLEASVRCYLAALQVRTRKAFPQNHALTQFNLGVVYQDAKQFRNAYNAFAAAIDTVEALRLRTISGSRIEGDKQKLAEEWNELYRRMVEVCQELGKPTDAIEYVERSKVRNLAELLATRDLYPKGEFPEIVLNELDCLRRKIAAEQRGIDIARRDGIGKGMIGDGGSQFLTTSSADARDTDLTSFNALRQQLDDLITQQIQPIDPSFSLTQRVEPISFQQIQELLPDDKTALIEWYILRETFVTFIITRQSPGITLWQSSPEDGQDLINWIIEYLQDYAQPSKERWKYHLESHLNRLADILHLEEVLTHVPDACDRVILIPHLFLHLFPLHALPLPNQKDKCLLDKFPRGVRYAPSCQLLQLTQKQERPDFSYFFGIQNPTQDLFYANLEVQTVRRFFEPAHVLIEENAKKGTLSTVANTEHLRAAHCAHFSCHGTFNFESPLKSALILADKEPLTLGEIFALTLSKCRLVTLSACETGLTDPRSISDEYISLPSGFLYAGALAVVSSLWAVSDLSTCFLMIKFYENLRNFPKLEAGDVAIALNQAQIWLRDLTNEEFEAVFTKYQLQIDEILAQLHKGDRFEFQDALDQARKQIQAPDRQPKPFANPYYWAAFTATGV